MIFIICLLIFSPHLSSTKSYASSPYDSGHDHGCDDAGISDSSDRYINQDEKGPSYHTSEFMDGYYAGFNSCSTNDNPQLSDEQDSTDESYPSNQDYPPNDSNGQGTDFGPICNLLQVALSNSCSDLVNSDGSLTDLGKDTVGCILGGATIGGAALTIPGIPPSLILKGLDLLSVPAGCGGLVNLDLLQSIGGANDILNQLANLIV